MSALFSGLTVDLSEAYLGSRHDQAMLKDSDLESVLRMHAKGHEGRQMMLYGDKGYSANDVIMTPFPGNEERMAPHRVDFNKTMSKCRIGVEHEFGRTRNVFRMTQYEGEWSHVLPTAFEPILTDLDSDFYRLRQPHVLQERTE